MLSAGLGTDEFCIWLVAVDELMPPEDEGMIVTDEPPILASFARFASRSARWGRKCADDSVAVIDGRPVGVGFRRATYCARGFTRSADDRATAGRHGSMIDDVRGNSARSVGKCR